MSLRLSLYCVGVIIIGVMAARETLGREEESGGTATEAPVIVTHVTQQTRNTYNFVNVGQVVQVSGSNNTIVLADNKVGVVQQNIRGDCQATGHAPPRPSSSPHTHTRTHPCSTHVVAIQSAKVKYAEGNLLINIHIYTCIIIYNIIYSDLAFSLASIKGFLHSYCTQPVLKWGGGGGGETV